MIDEDAARDLLTVADVSLAAASRHIADIDDADAQVAVQRLFDVVNTHQLLLRGHVEGHPA
jgi:hypothetical protein